MKRDYSDHEDRHAGTSSYASGYNGSCAGSSAGTSRHIGHTRSEAEELKYQGDALKQVLCTLYLPRMEHAQVSCLTLAPAIEPSPSPSHNASSRGAQQKLCPFTLRGINILRDDINRANRTEWQYAAMAKAFEWPANPRAESGQEGFDGRCVCCTAKPFDRFIPGMQQHADSLGQGHFDDLVQACVDDDDESRAMGRLLHNVLATALRQKTGAAPPAPRAKAAKQELGMEILWPPMLHIKGLATDPSTACDSAGKLKARFEEFRPAFAAPEFFPKFKGNAVLGFRPEHFEQALRLKDHLNLEGTKDVFSAEWVLVPKYDEWKDAKDKSKKHWASHVIRWGESVNVAPANLHVKQQEVANAALKVNLSLFCLNLSPPCCIPFRPLRLAVQEREELKETQAKAQQLTHQLAAVKQEATAKMKEQYEKVTELLSSSMTEVLKEKQCLKEQQCAHAP